MEVVIVKESEGQKLLGGRQNIKLAANQTAGAHSVMVSQVPAGTGVPVHTHENEDEIFQIVSGELEVTVGGELRLLNSGDMIFLPRNISHGFKAVTDTKMWVTFTPGGAEQMFTELATLPPGPPSPENLARICSGYGIKFQ